MMSALESTEMPTYGNISPHSLITYHSQLSLKETFSAFMVVYLHQSTLLIKLTNLIELWRCQLKAQFVIFYGLIQMIDVDGVFLQEVQVTHSVRILVNNLTIQTI
jgi:hypothetical protein